MQRLTDEVDVLVVGGGTAGHVAAIQAARAGARTAIIESAPMLGGTMTVGGVAAVSWFFAGARQVIAGIGWELVLAAAELDGADIPDFTTPPTRRAGKNVIINPHVYALVAEEACRTAGVALHYNEIVTEATDLGDRKRVQSVGRGLRRTVTTREVIDCTGDAAVVAMLGGERELGEVRQPGTLMFGLEGCDPAGLDEADVQRRFEAALADGRLEPTDFWRSGDRPFIGFLHQRGANAQHVPDADHSTAELQTATDLAGRASLLRLLRFVRTLPGCERARVAHMQPTVGVRETYRIVGETRITREDYLGGRVFPDAVAYSFFFVDIHTDTGVEIEPLPAGVVPTIPLSAMVPAGSRGLLAAGRCVASDRAANSGLRVEASCMAMGQAAGAAAALGVRRGAPSRDAPLAELRSMLREHGAIVPQVS
jgi:ribulose 1,5-bisphosphate synthetase/thiazole synthase